MKELIIWGVHFPAGSIALFAAIASFYYPKGSQKHRRAGRYFTVAMLIMLASGALGALFIPSPDDAFLAAFIIYTVFTAWLTAYHSPGQITKLEYLALAYIVLLGLVALSIDSQWDKIRDPNVYIIWPIVALMFAIGDIKHIRSHGLHEYKRLSRHIWRFSFSLIWAALAFGDKIIKILHSTIEEMLWVLLTPGIAVLLVALYWLIRINPRFSLFALNTASTSVKPKGNLP